jgi:hypothetical protein
MNNFCNVRNSCDSIKQNLTSKTEACSADVNIKESISNPWNDNRQNFCEIPRLSNKRRRRVPFIEKNIKDAERKSDDESCSESSKRRMRPAVAWMSVRDERKALQEIRNMENPLGQGDVKLKCIDMTTAEFALHYVLGHQNKRQNTKQKTKLKISSSSTSS